MKFITNRALAIEGDRVEAGQEIDLTEEDVAKFDPADLVSVDGYVAPAPEEGEEKEVADMSLDELKAKAEALELSKSGSKADLQERIALHLEASAPEVGED